LCCAATNLHFPHPILSSSIPAGVTDNDCKLCAQKVVPYLAKVWAKAEKAAEKKAKKLGKRADKLEAKRLAAEAEEKEQRKLEKAALRKEKQASWAREHPEEAAAFAAKKAAEATAAEAAAGIAAGSGSGGDGGGGGGGGGGGKVEVGYSHSVLRIGIMLLVLGNFTVLGLTKLGWISDDDVAFVTAKVYSYIK